MVAYLVAGMTQTGKTTYVKTKILPRYPNVLVYDVQNQYSELPFWNREKKGRFRINPVHMDFDSFVLLGQALTGFLFVYEEATQFLEGQIGKAMKANLVGKAHTKNRFLFFFHEFAQTPPRIIAFSDYIIQFRTGTADVMDKIKDKNIIEAWEKLETLPRFSKIIHKVSNQSKDGIF